MLGSDRLDEQRSPLPLHRPPFPALNGLDVSPLTQGGSSWMPTSHFMAPPEQKSKRSSNVSPGLSPLPPHVALYEEASRLSPSSSQGEEDGSTPVVSTSQRGDSTSCPGDLGHQYSQQSSRKSSLIQSELQPSVDL